MQNRTPKWLLTLLFIVLLGVGLLAAVRPTPQEPGAAQPGATPQNAPPAAQAAQPPQTGSEYAGSEVCASCHSDVYERFQKNPHQVLQTLAKKGWQGKACEACHGPGAVHAETADASKIRSFHRMTPTEITGVCLNCHARLEEHAGFMSGAHGRSQVSCTECHRIHEAGQGVHLWAVRSDQLCMRCHRETESSFNKPFRHKYQEGAIHCVDCHQPHGGLNPRQVRLANGNEVACFKCHTDKRGPFVFEHPPVRMEGCRACHEPHGSVNPKLLTRNRVYQLCLECHSTSTGVLADQPPAFHDIRSPRFQNCTTCHLRIHGSNVSPTFMR
jgi:DmsE family decaheme c-type cytochrome